MLILSQDKEKIINFDNVIQIYINTYANEYPDISCDKDESANSMFGCSIIPNNTYYEMPEK